MLRVGERHWLVERAEDLPSPRALDMFLDCETRSRHDDLRSPGNSPYQGDRAAMWGICWPGSDAYSVPLRMRDGRNLPVETVNKWLQDCLRASRRWINHKVKFDAHFARVDGVDPMVTKLVDTNTMAKLIDSDRMSHGLKDLSRDWLGRDYSSEDRIQAFLDSYKLPRGAKAKDYALVPTDLMAAYNCDDVLADRDLFDYCAAKMPAEVTPTWEVEQKLTPVLYQMEHLGLRTDERELQQAKVRSLHRQIKLATRLNELTGREFADSHAFSYSLIIGAWGLPVLSRNKKNGNPSFDADALKLYLTHPDVVIDPVKSESIKLMLALRGEETFCSLFVDSFLEHRDANGYVHSDYNQIIRTGRMSCKRPNAQQFDERAKQLIVGPGFADYDFSQIEFRVIVHYIRDEEAIRAFVENPKTDFHQWVADMCGIGRKPAKTVNFATAYGAGKRNIVGQLAANDDVVAAVTAELEAAGMAGDPKEFASRCWTRGERVYNAYHERLPTLDPTAKRAAAVARKRGFIFNVFGRQRHLPSRAAHVAFNTLCQGTAMDVIKRRMIDTSELYWPELRAAGITMRVNIHDAVVFQGEPEALREFDQQIRERLEAPVSELRVPMRVDGKITERRWAA